MLDLFFILFILSLFTFTAVYYNDSAEYTFGQPKHSS